MNPMPGIAGAEALAGSIDAELRALPLRNTPSMRGVRRKYSRRLRDADPGFVLALARELLENHGQRWVAYELIAAHGGAFQCLAADELEALGQGIGSWGDVDSFARTLAGPAWRDGLVSDELIHRWAHAGDRWWRRAALVSTIALNVRSHGGTGDVSRTLAVCRLLAGDRDDMVFKALSWALRELVVHDPPAVEAFLEAHERVLAARVKREVRHKLETGLKNPRRS